MKLTGSYEIKLDKKSVWRALINPLILKKSIPGCEEFTKSSETNFKASATNKIGPFNATFTGDIEIKDLNPPDSYKIVGEGNSSVGFASGEALVKLEESNGVTKLIYTVKANVGGKIAQVGSRLIDMTAKKMADIFFKNFSDIISSEKIQSDNNEEEQTKKKEVKDSSGLNFSKQKTKIISLLIILCVLAGIYLLK